MVSLPRYGADVSVDEVESGLREAGCAVIERVVPDEQIDRIAAELEPHLRATEPGADEFTGRNTRRTGALLARSPGFRDLAAHPIVLGALDRVLGDHATSYQLHLTQVIEIGPGEPAQLRAPRPVGVRLLRVPGRLRGRVPHDVGDARLHRGERRDARASRAATTGKTSCGRRPTRRSRPRCRRDRCCSTSGRCTTAAAPTTRRNRAAASTSATRSRGCARRRTSTSRARPRSRVSCPKRWPDSPGYQRGAYALGYYGDLHDPIDALHGPSKAAPSFATSNDRYDRDRAAAARAGRVRFDRAGARGRVCGSSPTTAWCASPRPPIPIPRGRARREDPRRDRAHRLRRLRGDRPRRGRRGREHHAHALPP